MKQFLIFACLLAITSSTFAQTYGRQQSRDQGWEFTIMLKEQGSDTISGPTGSGVDLSSNTGWGFTLGYNFNSRLNLAYEFSHTDPKYTANFFDENGDQQTLKHRSDFYTSNLNLSYQFMPGLKLDSLGTEIKPFIMAGAGWTTVDSNISDGNGYCYPDYYWGWVCYSSSYSETNFSYNAAIGLKADISKTMFLRGSYGRQWIDFGGASGDPEFDVFRLELGFKYY